MKEEIKKREHGDGENGEYIKKKSLLDMKEEWQQMQKFKEE